MEDKFMESVQEMVARAIWKDDARYHTKERAETAWNRRANYGQRT